MFTIINYRKSEKKGGDIHPRYILITYCDGIAWKKGYPHTVGPEGYLVLAVRCLDTKIRNPTGQKSCNFVPPGKPSVWGYPFFQAIPSQYVINIYL